ncbi:MULTISPECIES: hypothetical protein [Devosia]|nr:MULTISPECIES: hypothetical protein [Devosia]MCZ4345493.1 hypothetical protein [Devosia neptuniae]MCZ4347994.1 hypothetical protein [Devosia neptuniae]
MADFIYARDRIRRNTFPDISGSFGWPGVAAFRDACLVGRAL